MELLEKALEVAVAAANEAGKIQLMRSAEELQVSTKKGNTRNVVTNADKEADAAIRRIISEAFPDHTMVTEEDAIKTGSEYTWYVDPIDGTTNYSRKSKHFCVSIALAKGDGILTGVIFNPSSGEIYTAVNGKGSLLNGKPIKVSGVEHLNEAVIGFDMCYEEEKRLETAELIKKTVLAKAIRIQGSSALALCDIASGIADAYVHACGNSWDFAAGALIIREAGGTVKDFDNKEWSPRTRNGMVASCSEALNKEVLAKVKE